MKLLIVIALSTFVVAAGLSMFFTGTFKQAAAEDSESTEVVDATTEDAQGEAATENTQGETATEDTQGEEGNSQNQAEEQDPAKLEAKSQATLAKYEAQIAAAEAELSTIKAEIESLNSVKTSISRSQQLAKVYSSMKPDSAATILCQLDEAFTEQILSEMSTRTVGKIMDVIATSNPEYCVKLSKLMGGNDNS